MEVQNQQPVERASIDRIASDEEPYYIGSATRPKFHRPWCEFAVMIPHCKRVYFDSHRDAAASGRRPCGQCRA